MEFKVMSKIRDILNSLAGIAPLELAEKWDNVGLLMGGVDQNVNRILTCLTLTHGVAEEAIAGKFELVVTHHPLMFRPVQRMVSSDNEGGLLLKLARSGIAVYSPHTAYDNSVGGINAQLAELFGLRQVRPLRESDSLSDSATGSGRIGVLPQPIPLGELVKIAKSSCGATTVGLVGDPRREIRQIGIACGSAAEFLSDAVQMGCDAFVTGEARFHDCLKAENLNIAILLLGHYASERRGIEHLASLLASRHPECLVMPSQIERDPVQYV